MAEDPRLARFLEKIGAAPDDGDLAAIATEIEEIDFDEWALEQLTDAMREARERLQPK